MPKRSNISNNARRILLASSELLKVTFSDLSNATTDTHRSGCLCLDLRNASVSTPPTMAFTVAMEMDEPVGRGSGEDMVIGRHAFRGLYLGMGSHWRWHVRSTYLSSFCLGLP